MSSRRALVLGGTLALVATTTLGCGDATGEPAGSSAAPLPALPYASALVSFESGSGAGFGDDELPDVVLGPPKGGGTGAGSLDVLSLGKGGSIVLAFEPFAIVDGEGADFVVFENPFWPDGSAAAVFAEPGEVSVSEDGETWLTFACDRSGDGAGHFPGCAGVTPTEKYDARVLVPLDPVATGGDTFDLAALGLSRANFVKIHDVAELGATPTAGFDLDAVGIVNAERVTDEP